MAEQENALRALQLKLVSMLDKVDKFCNENDFTYYLIGGSALGAVRHEGFIPWDDDVDIAMSRPEFERFEQLAQGRKIDGLLYEPVEMHSFPEAPIGFLYDVSDPSIPLPECPCIDIFPLDGIPDSDSDRKKQKIFSYLYHISTYRQPSSNRGRRSYVITKLFVTLTPAFLFRFYQRTAKKMITKWDTQTSKNWANIFGMARYHKEIMPKEYFGTPLRMNFEGRMFPIPAKPHEYLTHLYGDYQELPPVENRQPKHMDLKWEGHG
ncbi:MAG: biosynthesis protein [Oscillospiraceae bacterium]|jgi:lipopolysaccharide cholinephosphotransferase|nr:biosynthesis protein [Oscillospiraceae bacterium]